MLRSTWAKAVATTLATGILLAYAGFSFVDSLRWREPSRNEGADVRLGDAHLSPDGRWVVLLAWTGERAGAGSTDCLVIELATGSVRSIAGGYPAPCPWDEQGLLRVLLVGAGEVRWLDPVDLATVCTTPNRDWLGQGLTRRPGPSWAERESLTSAEGRPQVRVRWSDRGLERIFPDELRHSIQLSGQEGVAFHSVRTGSGTRVERHALLDGTSRVLVEAAESWWSVSPDGSALVLGGRETWRVVDSAHGRPLINPRQGDWATWVPGQGGRFLFADGGREALLLDLRSNRTIALGGDPEAFRWQVLVLPDERLLVRKRATLELLDARGGHLRTLYPVGTLDGLRAAL